MKSHIPKGDSPRERAPTNAIRRQPPTVEEIRQRAHAIFIARSGTLGAQMEDWLRAERELTQERAGTTKDNAP